ncbi:hypothetical protein LAC81_34630 (plasmid) [Ensifer adhaerens]|uniref:hypothetical protein n=1 Tax=Ensifer adhaerens TaxID=106592 RepID=UPI001CBDB11F|nr:hypothetical protein [Ensifer adhaerens]MBZ7927094.1 hypothetical protein [Ensifer adhaerens]UAX98138.1 hypothetical protein LAC78_35930 [Ensifer adhaerens]UAY05520.1 hypothetical protein LAC80_34635 [Ensifer adhaerens]UAY12898.1 hypothetical protein LAC81_34630 [Ensifer adhaerens]
MFLVRIDFDDAIERWRDIILTSLPWDRLGGYVALRKHDLTIELHDIGENSDLLVFATDGEALADRFWSVYPFVVTYEGNPGYPLEYLVWLSFHMQANFDRLGVLEMSASYEDEDGDIESMSAVSMGRDGGAFTPSVCSRMVTSRAWSWATTRRNSAISSPLDRTSSAVDGSSAGLSWSSSSRCSPKCDGLSNPLALIFVIGFHLHSFASDHNETHATDVSSVSGPQQAHSCPPSRRSRQAYFG